MRSIILLVLLNGCGFTHMYLQGSNGPLHQCSLPLMIGTSNNIPNPERHFIKDTMKFWNQKLGKEVFFDMGIITFPPDSDEAAGLITVGYPENYVSEDSVIAKMQFKEGSNGCLGRTYIGLLQPLSSMNEADVIHALRHEFGHVLGLNDSQTLQDRLMYRSIKGKASEPAEEEIAALKLFY